MLWMVWQSHICNKTAIANLPPLLNSTSSSPSPPWYLHWCRANMGGNSHHRCQKWWILKWRKITKNVKSMKEVTFCKKKILTSSDLVTNSYGESCDLYSEKLRVLVHIQWVPVRKTRSPLCNQTVRSLYVTRQLIWRKTPKLFITDIMPNCTIIAYDNIRCTIPTAFQANDSNTRSSMLFKCWKVTDYNAAVKSNYQIINAVWSTFYWFPTEVWCFHWAEGLCPCGILTVSKRGCCWKRYPFLLLHILQGLKFYQVPDKKLRKLTSSLHWHKILCPV